MQLIQFLKSKGRTKAKAPELTDGESRPYGFSENAFEGLTRGGPTSSQNAVRPPPRTVPFQQASRLSKVDAAESGSLLTGKDSLKLQDDWRHREQLQTRFLEGGHKAMPEYELLELLLFNAIPTIDVKTLAKRLIAEFEDLNGVIAASKHRIMKVDGATESVFYHLRVAEAFAHRMSHAKLLKRDIIASWDVLLDYCRTVMAHREIEQFRVLFLNLKNELIADEEQAQGTIDHVPVYPREVAKRALELNASAIIVVHNHPSGDPTPSAKDYSMTTQLSAACEAIGVTVHDHLIIGKEAEFSFKQNGFMDIEKFVTL